MQLATLKTAIKDPARALRYLFVKMPAFAQKYVPLEEIFIKQEYRWLYQRIKPGTTLIDIGAYVGDSSIYFSFNPKVRSIYAYELVYKNYKEAKANLNHLGLLGRVTLENAGIDGVSRTIVSDSEHGVDSGASIENMSRSTGTHRTRIRSLVEILKGKKNVAIKSDAEGAEHRMLQNANLSEVYVIQMEYHNGVQNLAALLKKKGFRVRTEEKSDRPGEGYLFAESHSHHDK